MRLYHGAILRSARHWFISSAVNHALRPVCLATQNVRRVIYRWEVSRRREKLTSRSISCAFFGKVRWIEKAMM